ncbi:MULTISPECIES: MarR family winged helix-turn-helix transcriptional regulator [Leisingera]|uniref:MarR family winged helix-turn-helix transcriptional regulator n=1 Tax=Leisingera TaxID=191028 RepID=UPI0003FEAD88|nr:MULTISPECIES: MarR family winged helix-turn-helix transcriptional regulator [Leisingera]
MTFAQLIELAHRHAHRHWARGGARIGLSHSEYEYLRAIKEQEIKQTSKDDHGQHLQDVVEDLGVRKASASAMVVKLTERGLVERVPCRYDARAQHILLTPQGREMLQTGEEMYQAAARSFLSEAPGLDGDALAAALAEKSETG